MIHEQNSNLLSNVLELLIQDGTGGMKQVIEILLNSAMKAERENHLGAFVLDKNHGLPPR
jgi:hypothetical protein